jgi:hypothetical protein
MKNLGIIFIGVFLISLSVTLAETSDLHQVECTTTAVCLEKYGAEYVCDLSTNNFGKCIKSTIPNYCGNGKCDSLEGETDNTCPQDCSLNNEIIPSNNSNSNIYIIAGAIIIGFIMLAVLLKSRRD